MTANLTYSAHSKFYWSKKSLNTKLKIYEPLTCSILNYMAKAWTMMSEEMNALRAFIRKIVRKIYGPKK